MDALSSSEEESPGNASLHAGPSGVTTARPSGSTKNRTIWLANKDNDHNCKPPKFLGEHKVNVHGEFPIEYFLALFPESLMEHIVFQTNLDAVQKGKEHLLFPEGTTKRHNRKERCIIKVLRPFSIEVYNKHMGGVDLMDSMVARYRNDVQNKRGYLRMFYHLLNATVVNAWILWK